MLELSVITDSHASKAGFFTNFPLRPVARTMEITSAVIAFLLELVFVTFGLAKASQPGLDHRSPVRDSQHRS